MPSKNIIKEYVENGYYHIYNRGVEKRNIFIDHQDYSVFLGYLREYLSPALTDRIKPSRNGYVRKDFSKDINLLAFCLMPNHFHLLIKQNKEKSMVSLMRCLSTRYSMYFNRKYKRTGHLFQGIYKAVLINNDEHLAHVSRYIHINPKGINLSYQDYDYSSYDCYTKGKQVNWVKKDDILDYFTDSNKYEKFMKEESVDLWEALASLTIEKMHKVEPCASGVSSCVEEG